MSGAFWIGRCRTRVDRRSLHTESRRVRTALLIVLLLVVVPAGVFAWANSHKTPPSVLHVGLAPVSRVTRCVYLGDEPVAGCAWTGYAGTEPPHLVAERIDAVGCAKLANGLECTMRNGARCRFVVGQRISCVVVTSKAITGYGS